MDNTGKINYVQLVNKAMYQVIKSALGIFAASGDFSYKPLHIVISFLTNFPRVEIPDYLKTEYPEQMTIVLQHQFRNLRVTDDSFSVSLKFRGKEETLVIPFYSLVKYIDVIANFALEFHKEDEEGSVQYQNKLVDQNDENCLSSEDVDNNKQKEDNIIFIDQFRKNT